MDITSHRFRQGIWSKWWRIPHGHNRLVILAVCDIWVSNWALRTWDESWTAAPLLWALSLLWTIKFNVEYLRVPHVLGTRINACRDCISPRAMAIQLLLVALNSQRNDNYLCFLRRHSVPEVLNFVSPSESLAPLHREISSLCMLSDMETCSEQHGGKIQNPEFSWEVLRCLADTCFCNLSKLKLFWHA